MKLSQTHARAINLCVLGAGLRWVGVWMPGILRPVTDIAIWPTRTPSPFTEGMGLQTYYIIGGGQQTSTRTLPFCDAAETPSRPCINTTMYPIWCVCVCVHAQVCM